MTLKDKILNINKVPGTSILKPLHLDSAKDIQTFWNDVVAPMLPDYDTMKKWHKLFIDYISLSDAVFMIRKGNEESKHYIESVPADALRRGFLTKTDAGYWFTYNDNDFATYMLAMVLDGDIIDTLTPKELLRYLQTPNSIVRFNQSGKDGVEKRKAYYKIDGPQPRISKNGYTVAHIFDVNSHYYDSDMGFYNKGGEDALKSAGVKIDKGMYSDYIMQKTVSGRNIYFRDHYHPGKDARVFLEAHMLRFLHPLNYFCAPKDNMNGYVYCEFTDHINLGKPGTRRFHRISGYERLLYYAHHRFREKYGDIYVDFLKRAMLPLDANNDAFGFFENCSAAETSDYYGSEIVDAKYGNPLSSRTTAKPVKAPATPKNTIDLDNINYAYLDSFKVGEIANQVLRAAIESGVRSGKLTKADVESLKTEKGPSSAFKLSLPLLSLDRVDANGELRYYKDPILCYGESLYLNSQWPKRDVEKKKRLIQWILDWVKTNGALV